MQAIFLCGGFGTRLQSMVKDVPKPMADINGNPFLYYLVNFYKKQDVVKFILSIGYKADIIREYFKSYESMLFCEEKEPLGTGGAIRNILLNNSFQEDFYVVINGDTFVDISLEDLKLFHYNNNNDISLALVKMVKFDRYGSVELKDNRIVYFNEKKYCKSGYINAGVYILNKNIFNNIDLPIKFSFEDFLALNLNKLKIGGKVFEDSYFIDIGIPSDYQKAIKDFKDLF